VRWALAGRYCTCDTFVGPSEPWGRDRGNCLACWRYHNDPRYRALWGGNGATPPAPAGPCVHLGAPTGETVQCPSCRGRVELKLFACAVHGRCTQGKAAPGVACCAGCPDRTARPPYPPPTLKNLLYHVAPFSGNGVWQRNVAHLVKRIALFDGRRVVAVVTGAGLDPPGKVRAALAGHVHEFIELPNDPGFYGRRETTTFLPLLERVCTSDPGQVTWYGHAKGVTRPVAPGVSVHPWTRLLYETTLDYWPLAETLLGRFPVVGAFKKPGRHFEGSQSAWHYSGSFLWFRNAELFARDWRRVDHAWWGTESYPGLHFRPEEAGCLFHESPHLDLYHPDYIARVLGEYEGWRAAHEGRRTTLPC
jgi:hypothetical protein